MLISPLRTNLNEILIEIHTFSFKKIQLKMSFGKWRPFCLGLNVLKDENGTLITDGGDIANTPGVAMETGSSQIYSKEFRYFMVC